MADSVAQCCRREQWEEAAVMIEAGASVDIAFGNHQYTALHFAAMHGAVACARLLIVRGCNVNATGKDGLSPLHLSVQNRHKDMSTLLLQSGADMHLGDLKGNQPFLGAPWHAMMFPCLVAPSHDAIRRTIQVSVAFQAANLDLRKQASRLHHRIAHARSNAFIARTILCDSVKHREAVEDDIAALDADIFVTESAISTNQAMLTDLCHGQVEYEALLEETAAATTAKHDEFRAWGTAHANEKCQEAHIDNAIDVVQTHLRDKCETLACMTQLVMNEKLQEHSFRALTKLCLRPDMCRKLLSNGLIATVLNGLDVYPSNVRIQMDGIAILFQIVAKTGTFPATHLQRMAYSVSTALLILRNSSAINYATDANLAAVGSFVSFATDASVEASALRSIHESVRVLHKQQRAIRLQCAARPNSMTFEIDEKQHSTADDATRHDVGDVRG
ncbi:hypothetical protein H257_10962 [Aphanomyces astaci]|uniref:Uncharacterized protein n=1 Tax=Aphanomyces astaci TaxID=112090 RepID=W4G604_APHAT|nr:hypothetical protein H257_10962 [Aphanomyces astaci]ETV74368.1 hypothetical protein H257_10962 [Aphanomyces astaci]|eukprot:XP_009836026.1 hypothetical protein H257_10962 [Aphanomyces astaci]